MAGLAVHVDEAPVLLDNAVHGRQTQSGSRSHRLGREKRLKEVRLDLAIHAAAGIADRYHDISAGNESDMRGAIGLIKDGDIRLDDDPACIGNGIPGVDAEIDEDLVYLARLAYDLGRNVVQSEEVTKGTKRQLARLTQLDTSNVMAGMRLAITYALYRNRERSFER